MTQLGAVLSTGEAIRPISADSHIVEAPNCYTDNIEAKYKDTAPRIKRLERDGILMNPERMMWANDYPHGDSTWPNSQPMLAQHAAHLSDTEKKWILRDKLRGLYKLA